MPQPLKAGAPNPWEVVYLNNAEGANTYRMPVPGGWLYMVRSYAGGSHAVAVEFVAKPARAKPTAAEVTAQLKV